jgi:hypothetical protein
MGRPQNLVELPRLELRAVVVAEHEIAPAPSALERLGQLGR